MHLSQHQVLNRLEDQTSRTNFRRHLEKTAKTQFNTRLYLCLEFERFRSFLELLLESGIHGGGLYDSIFSHSKTRPYGASPCAIVTHHVQDQPTFDRARCGPIIAGQACDCEA